MNANNNLRHVIMTIGLFLVGISLYCSFLLYTSFSPNLSDKAAWGGMGLGLDMFKNIALLAAFALWTLGFFAARIISVLVFAAYALLSVLSFVAFFGFMATVQHKLEKDVLLDSNKYNSAVAAVESAEAKLSQFSRYADAERVAQAEAELANLQPRIAQIRQDMSRYANPDCTPKRDRRGAPYTTLAGEWCAKLRAAQAEAQPWQAQISGYSQYQAALSHRERMLNELANLDSGSVDTGAVIHPMFVDLGKLVAAAPDEMKVMFMFVSSAAAEILGTLSVLIAWMLGRKRSFTLDEIEHMSTQLREQQGRLQHALGLSGMQPAFAGLPGYEVNVMPSAPKDAVKSSPMSATSGTTNPAPMGGTTTQRTAQTATPPSQTQTSRSRQRRDPRPPIKAWAKPIPLTPEQQQAALAHMTEAVLAAEQPPRIFALAQRYGLTQEAVRVALDILVTEGYLLNDPRTGYVLNLKRIRADSQEYYGELMCGGIEYHATGGAQKVFFPNPGARLPVRNKNGLGLIYWGRRKHERHSSLPPGAHAPLQSVRGGEWNRYQPRGVLIPASSYMEQDIQGGRHWFKLAADEMIQGLVATHGHEQRLYIVTIEPPAEFLQASDSQPNSECWPRLVKYKEEGVQPVFH
jgi:hypothetical protein